MTVVLSVAILALTAMGCAKPPEADLSAARQAIEAARSAEATEYAPESMQAAEDAMRAVEAELQVQEEKFALFRSYKDAKAKVADVQSAAQKAQTDAQAGKEAMRAQATEAIAAARTRIEETKTLLASAPTGKGTAADIAMLKNDLMSAETMLGEAEAALAAGKVKEALANTNAAMSGADQVKMAVEAAIQARGGRR
jgi:hypothetical protein